MAYKIIDQLEIKNNGENDLGTPPSGMVTLGVVNGRVVAKDDEGIELSIGYGHVVVQSDGTQMPNRRLLKISGGDVIVSDDESADTTLITVNVNTGTPGHVIVDGEATQYAQRSKLVFEGPGVAQITDDSANGATIVNISGGGSGGPINAYVSNCILTAPSGYLTYSSNAISAAEGLSVLVPNGLNGDGTFADLTVSLTAPATVIQSLGASAFGIVFLMGNGTLSVVAANLYVESPQIPTNLENIVWYNSFDNVARQYDSTGTLTGHFFGIPIGTFTTDGNGDIDSVSGHGVTRINNYTTIKYWDL